MGQIIKNGCTFRGENETSLSKLNADDIDK